MREVSVKRIALALTFAFFLAVEMPPASAATQRQLVPFHTTVVACSGERVHLSGQVLLIDHFVQDAHGGFHDTFTLVPRHVTGVSSSGVVYHAVGGQRDTSSVSGSEKLTDTFTSQFIVVSENGDQNLQVVDTAHITITPDDDVTAFFSHFRSRCVG